jgi:uncharacterized protein
MSVANARSKITSSAQLTRRLAGLDFSPIKTALDEKGFHVVSSLLNDGQCNQIKSYYDDETRFRSSISMSRYNFGSGEYRYFGYPLPDIIGELRTRLYVPLALIANDWNAALRKDNIYPQTHAAYLDQCLLAGQRKPTPLILKYQAGDYNCLHQDVYGEMLFPLQVAILLSKPEEDFVGGEFVLTEQRPRMQSRPHVVPLNQGDAIIFAVNDFPRQGTRGHYRVKMRHGVSEIRDGERFTTGIIFHDAS